MGSTAAETALPYTKVDKIPVSFFLTKQKKEDPARETPYLQLCL